MEISQVNQTLQVLFEILNLAGISAFGGVSRVRFRGYHPLYEIVQKYRLQKFEPSTFKIGSGV